MASCTHCTRTLPDDTQICPFCGRKISAANAQKPKEDLLFQIRESLKQEQKLWKILALSGVVADAILLACAAWSFLRADVIALVLYGVLLCLSIPCIWVNLVQFGKIEDYIDGIYVDCSPAIERADGRKDAVLGLVFNPFALKVFLKNREFIQQHRGALKEIIREQDLRYESTFNGDRFHHVD